MVNKSLINAKSQQTFSKMVVELKIHEKYAELVLQRPPANAYEYDFMQELNSALDEIQLNPGIVVVLIKSALDRFFCAGADLHVFGGNTPEKNKEMVRLARLATHKIESSSAVFIAAINGHCLGGGLELALACDLRIGMDGTYQIGLPEINIGLIPGNGGTQRLPRVIGSSKAFDLMINRKNLLPDEALTIGLFHQLIKAEMWESETEDYVKHLSNGPGLAMMATKKAIKEGMQLPLDQALELEKALLDPLENSQDYKEGIKAFKEKRQPEFKGK